MQPNDPNASDRDSISDEELELRQAQRIANFGEYLEPNPPEENPPVDCVELSQDDQKPQENQTSQQIVALPIIQAAMPSPLKAEVEKALGSVSVEDSNSEWALGRAVRDALRAVEVADQSDADRDQTLVTTAPVQAASSNSQAPVAQVQPVKPLVLSTLMSLMVVLVLLVSVRLVVPPLVESTRYAWYRGQLRAEHDLAGEFLNDASLTNMAETSPLVSMRVAPSVVHVNLRQTMPPESPSLSDLLSDKWGGSLDNPFGDGIVVGQGSGVIIDKEGYIITNHHVIDGGEGIEVTLSDGRRSKASVVAIDSVTDLAVLKINLPDLIPIQWGDSDRTTVGSPVWAVGSPYGLSNSVTMGILSGKHRADLRGTRFEESVRGDARYGDLMQSDVAVNPGNSGGPLVDKKGQVIGINTAILGESYRGVSFAIPSNVAKFVADRLIRSGEMARGWLGVSLRNSVDAKQVDEAGRPVRGAYVEGLVRDLPSPGRDAGLIPGDVIVNYNTVEVPDHLSLIRMIGETEVGSTVPMIVRRGESFVDLQVLIAPRPKDLSGR